MAYHCLVLHLPNFKSWPQESISRWDCRDKHLLQMLEGLLPELLHFLSPLVSQLPHPLLRCQTLLCPLPFAGQSIVNNFSA